MKISRRLCAILALPLISFSSGGQAAEPPVALVVHGGSGTLPKPEMTPEKRTRYEAGLRKALEAGYAVLRAGGRSLDAVEASVKVLEDDPLFNAGRGAVFTYDGAHELDSAIMDGKTLAAGAVAGVRHVRNPVSLARAVMEKSPHVMLTGAGAEEFALGLGIPLVSQEYFFTQERWDLLQEVKKEAMSSHKASSVHPIGSKGTVGAVALDRAGNLAAATSTGGMTNKRWGRVGDSPIIGAGTYANNNAVAVSATGHGEYFIRTVVGHEVYAQMAYGKKSVADAANDVVNVKLKGLGGEGGIIALDTKGNIATPFNSEGMYRGWVDTSGKVSVKVYAE